MIKVQPIQKEKPSLPVLLRNKSNGSIWLFIGEKEGVCLEKGFEVDELGDVNTDFVGEFCSTLNPWSTGRWELSSPIMLSNN